MQNWYFFRDSGEILVTCQIEAMVGCLSQVCVNRLCTHIDVVIAGIIGQVDNLLQFLLFLRINRHGNVEIVQRQKPKENVETKAENGKREEKSRIFFLPTNTGEIFPHLPHLMSSIGACVMTGAIRSTTDVMTLSKVLLNFSWTILKCPSDNVPSGMPSCFLKRSISVLNTREDQFSHH